MPFTEKELEEIRRADEEIEANPAYLLPDPIQQEIDNWLDSLAVTERMTNREAQIRQRRRAYREAHREEIRAYNRAWRLANIEHVREYDRRQYRLYPGRKKEYKALYYQAHREETRARQKAYYQENKEVFRERNAAYRESHKAELKAKKAAWYQRNRERILAKQRERKAAERDIGQKIKRRLRCGRSQTAWDGTETIILTFLVYHMIMGIFKGLSILFQTFQQSGGKNKKWLPLLNSARRTSSV